MIYNLRFATSLKIAFLISVAVFSLSRCADEDEFISPAVLEEVAANPSNDQPFSLNISGIHSFAEKAVDCKTCKFIVPSNVVLIDGEKLALKPGDVICLDAAVKYGSLEFINLNGKIENPIIIAHTTCNVN